MEGLIGERQSLFNNHNKEGDWQPRVPLQAYGRVQRPTASYRNNKNSKNSQNSGIGIDGINMDIQGGVRFRDSAFGTGAPGGDNDG